MALYKITPDPDSLYKHLELFVDDEIRSECCLMVEDGEHCELTLHSRGFCFRHEQILKGLGLAGRYDFLNGEHPEYEICNFDNNNKKCRIVENGVKCEGLITSKGLCKRHYACFRNKKCLDEYALPEAKKKEYEAYQPDKDNLCRIVENGVKCERLKSKRGLCKRHYACFLSKKCLDNYALPSSRKKKTKGKIYD